MIKRWVIIQLLVWLEDIGVFVCACAFSFSRFQFAKYRCRAVPFCRHSIKLCGRNRDFFPHSKMYQMFLIEPLGHMFYMIINFTAWHKKTYIHGSHLFSWPTFAAIVVDTLVWFYSFAKHLSWFVVCKQLREIKRKRPGNCRLEVNRISSYLRYCIRKISVE